MAVRHRPTAALGQDGRVPSARPDVPAAAPPQRVDASMSLLVDMMEHTLDEAYAERAAQRTGDGGPAPAPASAHPRRRSALALLSLVVVGLVTGTAIGEVRERQEAATGLRAGLAEEVRRLTATSDDLAERTESLRAEVEAVRAATLGSDVDGKALTDRLTALGLASGTTPVRGPGIVLTLRDAPGEDLPAVAPGRPGTAPDGRVQDRDLQDVVNGLWAAGAEAISVNDQRLTARTAIRGAGEAILVDFRPLSGPYEISALGDPEDLELEFLDGPSGRRLQTFQSLYGIVFDVRRADSLSLPGAAAPELRSARALEPS